MARDAAESRAPAVGIDLGTTHSCVAYLDKDARPIIIRTRDGDKTMPSHVAFTRTGRIVGARAKTDTEKDDQNTIYDAKRLLGKSYDDSEVAEDLQTWPFTVVRDLEGLPKYRVQERGQEMLYAPEQISGMVLAELRDAAQQHFGPSKLVADAVITVPAYFNDDQRQATKAAAEIAKLNVLHIINEPTAAALAFGLSNPAGNETRHVLVFDLGGGTFDTVLLERSNELLQVRNVGGDTHLGGQDFDWQLMKVALRSWDSQYPDIVIDNGSKAWRRLRLACELAKKELSKSDVTAIDVVSLAGDEDLFMEIDREEFEFEVSPLFDRCMAHVTSLLEEAKVSPGDGGRRLWDTQAVGVILLTRMLAKIPNSRLDWLQQAQAEVHDVVVVGGASRMPGLRAHLEDMFPAHYQAKLHMTDAVVDADEAVAIGAAVMAAQKSVQPDNWRPGGAALMSNRQPGPKIVDATPMTLGIQHGDFKKMHALIAKGSPLPAQGSQSFTTLMDNQTVIDFKVFEGEQTYTCDNHMLGKFQMPNVAWGPAGSAYIIVTMHIGEDGVLHTTAVDQDSGTARELVVTAMNRADSAAIAEMTKQEAASSSLRGKRARGAAVAQQNGGGGSQQYQNSMPAKRNSKMTGF